MTNLIELDTLIAQGDWQGHIHLVQKAGHRVWAQSRGVPCQPPGGALLWHPVAGWACREPSALAK
jgi:hypothetical protein